MHPGYGFLAENAGFAQAVIDAGLIWIGPPPAAIDALGDKVQARHIAQKVGAPLVAGTPDPVNGADEVVAFAREHGLPIAIKAAFGGGGRGLKVARKEEEVAELYESAVREAVTAFGRGECFVERYLDKPRHVETQCLADQHGNVVVVSTRDCSLQRRHQKLVEEAPAPYLSDAQMATLYDSSKAILKEAGYHGAGTCEFLVGQDGTISFLEVNTRLQVEHPVTEEVTGIDLVREMFRIAAGEELGYDDPVVAGHSIEFRINAEDAGRNFMPAPGTLTRWHAPSGPGVRLDGGYDQGETVPGLVRLARRQADRHRHQPRAGARPVPAGARRVRGRGHADGDPVPPRRRRRPGLRRRRRRRSASTPAGSRPSSTTRSRRTTAARETDEPGERETVTVEVGGKRLWSHCRPASRPPAEPRAAAGKPAKRSQGQEGRRRRDRRHPGRADAGHHRQARRRGRPDRRGRRPGRRPRGDEDGAADQRAQGRHHHRTDRRRRRHRRQRRGTLRDQGLTGPRSSRRRDSAITDARRRTSLGPMFSKVLVANRGEIAVRAFRAAYELGAKTVAVFPYEDRGSEHRLKADEAYEIGEHGHPVRAYLDPDAIVDAALRSGAEAIYPGYGFLSENPALAEACADQRHHLRRPVQRGAAADRQQGERGRRGPSRRRTGARQRRPLA